jgi:D-alanyl-lipoteichoic acid acyltransferase DltB (MBOAT superfamily)
MSLAQVLLLVIISLIIRVLFPGKLRAWIILAVSVLVVYWLQPSLPIRQLDFWLPTASIGLIFFSWGLTTDSKALKNKNNWLTAGFVLIILLLISLTRFFSLEGILTSSRPPKLHIVTIVLAPLIGLTYILVRYISPNKIILYLGIVVVFGILLILKTPSLLVQLSMRLRSLVEQSSFLARKTDLDWLGYSYLAFRIIHVLIDRLKGRLPDLMLKEYFIYAIFYPTFLAGPIDRFQRFQVDLEQLTPITSAEMRRYSIRLWKGLFKKFILADTLAFFALTSVNANQVHRSGWLWVMTVAYSLQLYFDFAGYTDLAIASGGFLGFRLPENFDRPYLQPNITKFWNSWHISLTQWIRAYYFNPLTRFFRKKSKLPSIVIIFIVQISTMLLIGLWHGVAVNFLIWGAWHGLGLFIHNRWSNTLGKKVISIGNRKPKLAAISNGLATLATFIFVSVGWLWFTIPDIGLAWHVLLKLFCFR